MPISLSSKKSLRKALKNYKANAFFKIKLKKVVKTFVVKPSEEGLKKVYSILDILGKKNIFHKNKVARLKAKYAKAIVKKKTAKKM